MHCSNIQEGAVPDEAIPPSPDIRPIQRLTEDLPVPTVLLEGPAHRIAYVNPAFSRTVGRGEAELVGLAAAAAFPRQAVQGRVPLLDLVRSAGQPVLRRAQPLRLKADEPRFWDLEATPLRQGGSAVVGILLQCRDVTAQQQALRQGEAARATLDALFAHVPEGLAIGDGRAARLSRVSAHGLAMVGRSVAEVLGQGAELHPETWRVCHPDGSPAAAEELPLARAAAHGELVQDAVWQLRDASGGLIPVICNAGPIRDSAGRITGGIVAWRDMSEVRRAEAALRASEARFRSLAEAMPHGVWQTDAAGRIEYLNARWRDYGGEAAAAGWGALLHPGDAGRFIESWAAMRAAGAELDVDVRLRRAVDGAWRWFRVKGAPIADAAGGLRHWVGTCTDIEDRRQAEDALRQALAAQRMLAREADHRIKNSLQLVAALLRLQSGRAADPMARAALEAATARVQAVAEAHRALQNSADLRSVHLHHMLRDLATAAAALHPGADIRMVAPEGLTLDAERAIPLALVLSELVTNALKHAYPPGQGGPVYLLAEAVGERLLAVVADDGCGAAEGSSSHGSLGETVVRSLARQIGATLTRTANGARGLRVELDLPLDPSAAAPGVTAAPFPGSSGHAGPPPP
jgi:PAS domain S-box-containing protein